RLVDRTWLASLAQVLDKPLTYQPIGIDEFNALREQLGGVLDVYRGKDAAGSIYDTREWSKADSCDDLAAEQQFIDETKDLDPVSEDILFSAHDDETVRLKISANGSIWFRTVVS